jgi:type II secretory pathway component GspD/PulD (secretin)
MLRVLFAAALASPVVGAQDLPVSALAGGVRAQAPLGQPARPLPPVGQLPPLPVTQLDSRDVSLDSPRRLTLAFAEPRPIDEVLALLTAGTRFSVAIDADATGAFRGELKQLTLREALATILAPLGLDDEVQGTVIRVRRRQLETRLFELDLLNVQRALTRTTRAPDAALTTVSPPDDIAAGIGDAIRSLLSERGTVHVDPRAGIAQVMDFGDRLDRVALYVEALHERRGRQVRLQAQAVEVTLREPGSIDWRQVRERLGLPRDAPDAGLTADPVALRAALAAQGDVRILWAPDVTVVNNEAALIHMAAPGGSSLTMTVVPQISADGVVQLSVSHAWGEPSSRVSEADTVMRVIDGATALIAGLTGPAHAELVVLLRPTVVTPGVAGGRN